MAGAAWYEIWVEEQAAHPYVLLLRPAATDYEVLDPAEGYRRVFLAPSYQEAAFWLAEDEFEFAVRIVGSEASLTPHRDR